MPYRETGYDKIQFANGTRAEIEANKSKMNVFEPVIATDEDRMLYLGADGEIKDISVNAEAEIKAELNNKVNKSGDTMTNTLTLSKPDSLVQILNIENGKSFLEASNQTGGNVFLGGTGTTWYGHVSGQGIWRNYSDDIGWWGVHKDGDRVLDYNFATNTLTSKGNIALGLNGNLNFNKDNYGVGWLLTEEQATGKFKLIKTIDGALSFEAITVEPASGNTNIMGPLYSNQFAKFTGPVEATSRSGGNWVAALAANDAGYRCFSNHLPLHNRYVSSFSFDDTPTDRGFNIKGEFGLLRNSGDPNDWGKILLSSIVDRNGGTVKAWDWNMATGDFSSPGNINAYSDIKLKKDLEIIPNALDKIEALNGYTYTRKDTGFRQTGVVAQEVQAVLPEAVTVNSNADGEETLSVAYGNMVGLLIEGIKELKAEVEELKAKLEVK